MRLTADQISLSWLESAHVEDLKSAMRAGGDVLNAVNALLVTPEGKKIAYEMLNDPDYVPKSQRQPTPEEAAQIADDTQRAEAQAAADAEALASAAETPVASAATISPAQMAADDAAARAIGATLVRNANGEIEKIVIDYQVRNDEGQAIGRPTHLEARTWVDMTAKLIAAHTNAVTYSERVKNNRLRQSTAALESSERSAAAKAAQAESERLATEAVNEKDPVKMQEAIKKAASADRDAQIAEQTWKAHGKIIAETWMFDHQHDFFVCQASINLLGDYMKANNLPMSYENLERTFQAVKHQLPPVPTEQQQATAVPTSVAVSTNPTPAATVAPAAQSPSIPVTAAAATVNETPSQPSAELPAAQATAQASTPAAANQPQAARRPGVNGGLQPGSLSAARPSTRQPQQAPEATRSDLLRAIAKMGNVEFRKKLRDKNYVAQLDAAGIKYM